MKKFNAIGFGISFLVCIYAEDVIDDRPDFVARIIIEPKAKHQLIPEYRICGGTIVHPKYLLSAAQCYQDFEQDQTKAPYHVLPKDVKAYLGSIDIDDGILHEVQEIHKHPGYNNEDRNYDIALLKTVHINFTRGIHDHIQIRPVILQLDDAPFGGYKIMKIYAWGVANVGGEIKLNSILQKLVVSGINEENCKRVGRPNSIANIAMCAYDAQNKSFCFVDAGGPLMAEDKQIGIVSRQFTTDTHCSYRPNIFTKVTADFPWVYNITKIFLLSWVADKCHKDVQGPYSILVCPDE